MDGIILVRGLTNHLTRVSTRFWFDRGFKYLGGSKKIGGSKSHQVTGFKSLSHALMTRWFGMIWVSLFRTPPWSVTSLKKSNMGKISERFVDVCSSDSPSMDQGKLGDRKGWQVMKKLKGPEWMVCLGQDVGSQRSDDQQWTWTDVAILCN